MSSSSSPQNREMPYYSRLFSLKTLTMLIIVGCSMAFASILLWAGTGIMNVVIERFGTEILSEKLSSVIQPVDYNYATLQRIGLEDSAVHKQEIKINALRQLAGFRYHSTGTIYVISNNGKIVLSEDFKDSTSPDFDRFFQKIQNQKPFFEFSADSDKRFSVARYYPPWKSYIGIAIDKAELFAYKDQFVNIVLMLLGAVLLGTLLFTSLIQRLVINPLIRISRFADNVAKGEYNSRLEGTFILELDDLKVDVEQMVSTLRQKMDETTAQLQLIRERERWLDEALGALQESEKKYRTIYNAPSDAIFIYDPENRRITDVNKAMFNMFGYQHDELLEMNLGDLGVNELQFTGQEAEKLITAALENGNQLFEWMGRKKDGEIFWIEVSLQATNLEGREQIIGVMRNIHLRKMTEQELASQKERLAVTLRSIGDGVITTDERGRIILMNRVAETLTGWRQHEAAGRLFSEVFHIVHQDSGERCLNPAEEILQGAQAIDLAPDTILIAKDGSRRNIADSGAPIRDPQSNVIGAVIVFRDVTEEKRMEEELLKIKKLESVGVLAGGIAHDFNNLLVGILGNISLARQCLDDHEKVSDMLSNTEKAALRAKDLTGQLLTFSRGGEPVIKSASIVSTITESAEFALRGSNVKFNLSIPDDLWLANVDTGQISQVIQNIILNARQALSEGGTIDISCSNCTGCASKPRAIRDKCVRVVIKDDGPGISPEIIDKVFDPYFTTKEDGSGLGLAICHSIIMKHHGSISVESKPGQGTSFIINLPVSPEMQEEKPDKPYPLASHRDNARILIMDDDTMILDLSRQMLEFLGHDVVTVERGEEALEIYEQAMQQQNPFNLVIMDLTVPGGMGGEKAVKELLKIDPGAKAIVSSGYSNDKVLAEYVRHGFKAVVVKPYQIEDLDEVVRQTLES